MEVTDWLSQINRVDRQKSCNLISNHLLIIELTTCLSECVSRSPLSHVECHNSSLTTTPVDVSV